MTGFILVSLFAGLISCDTLAVGQFMLSRPIIAAPLAGLIVGDPYMGFIVGVCVELIWIRIIPVGVSVPPDSPLTAVIAVWAAAAAKYHYGVDEFSAAVLALAVAVPFGVIYKSVEIKVRFYNSGVADSLKTAIIRGRGISVGGSIFRSISRTFIMAALFFAAAAGIISLFPAFYWKLFGFLGLNTKMLVRYIYILCFAQLFETLIRWK